MVWGTQVFSAQEFQLLLIQGSCVPKSLHFAFQAMSIEIAKHIHQVIQFLFVMCSCK